MILHLDYHTLQKSSDYANNYKLDSVKLEYVQTGIGTVIYVYSNNQDTPKIDITDYTTW
jgi:hypothetical protein